MQEGLLRLARDLPGRMLGHRLVDIVQFPAGLHRQHLHHRRTFEVIKVVVGLGNGRARDDDAVVAQEQDVLVAHCPAHPLALVVGQRHAAVLLVVGDAAPVAEGVLGAHLDAAVADRGQGRRIGHVGVQNDLGPRVAGMDAGMDVEGGRLDLVLALDDVALAVGHHDVGRRDLRPVQPLRIDQEQVLAAGHGHAEVIAHPFVQSVPCRRSQRGGQVDPRLGDRVVRQHLGELHLRRPLQRR